LTGKGQWAGSREKNVTKTGITNGPHRMGGPRVDITAAATAIKRNRAIVLQPSTVKQTGKGAKEAKGAKKCGPSRDS